MNLDAEGRRGALYAATAFFCWGVIPLYFMVIRHVPVTEILVHRVTGVCLCAVVVLWALGLLPDVGRAWRDPRILMSLAISGTLIAINWLVFTWAATNQHLLDTSMGYFINPLFSVLLGVVVLGERLRPLQKVSVALAGLGVAQLVIAHGRLPWIAIVLPLTFGLYGLIRKQTPVHALVGLFTETTLMLPLAAAYLGYLAVMGVDHVFNATQSRDYLVLLSGPFTVVPLGLFAAGARRITLTTVGFLQYIAPTMTFFIGLFVFHEPFDRVQLVTFACIWVSLAVFTVDGLRVNRVPVPPPVAEEGV